MQLRLQKYFEFIENFNLVFLTSITHSIHINIHKVISTEALVQKVTNSTYIYLIWLLTSPLELQIFIVVDSQNLC